MELCSDEVETGLRYTTDTDGLDIEVHAASRTGACTAPLRLARICNNAPQGGSLGKQIEGLLQRAAAIVAGSPRRSWYGATEYQPKTPNAAIARTIRRDSTKRERSIM